MMPLWVRIGGPALIAIFVLIVLPRIQFERGYAAALADGEKARAETILNDRDADNEVNNLDDVSLADRASQWMLEVIADK